MRVAELLHRLQHGLADVGPALVRGFLRLLAGDLPLGEVEERLAWKRARHTAPDVAWPPPGVHLWLDFAPADGSDSPRPPGPTETIRYA